MEKVPFDFSKNYILENETVKLVPLNEIHFDDLRAISSDEKVWTYFIEKGLGQGEIIKYCLSAMGQRSKEEEYPFVIFDKRSNKYAGMTRMYNYDRKLRTVKIGHTWLGHEFWGTQLNRNCKFLLFEFVFESLNIERIGFGVHAQNKRSINALLSIGCKQEGILRNFLPSIDNYSRVDLLLFGIIKPDWQSEVKEMLKNKLI